ncbi:MAG TPA: ribonuclease III [Coriobacteriia bacterium]|nr:ribonuclease III [Coriobacteriia bacterium]
MTLSTEEKVALAESILGHVFADKALLQKAITHPSAVNDTVTQSFERLEFLGDSVITAVVDEEIFTRFPRMSEGGMTRIRISLVAGPVLASVAQSTGLEGVLILGESEIRSGGRGRVSALEDVYEAVSAALYLDAGIDAARRWVLGTLGPLISEDVADSPANPKSVLQELVQAAGNSVTYRITDHHGPPHDRSFTAVVEVGGEVVGTGVGRSKREAEAAAAAVALDMLRA